MNLKHQETPETETKTAYSPQTPSVEEQQNTPTAPPTHIRKLLRTWLRFHPISKVAYAHLNALPVSPQYPMHLLKQTMPRNGKVLALAAWLLSELTLKEEEKQEVIHLLGKTAETNNRLDNALTPIRYMLRSSILASAYMAFLNITS